MCSWFFQSTEHLSHFSLLFPNLYGQWNSNRILYLKLIKIISHYMYTEVQISCVSRSHRIVEAGRILLRWFNRTPLSKHGQLELVIQSCVQLDIQYIQGWRLSLSGHPVYRIEITVASSGCHGWMLTWSRLYRPVAGAGQWRYLTVVFVLSEAECEL